MATNFTVGRTIECWKKHTCSACGGTYRYKFVRKLSAQGNSEKKALEALNKKIDSAVGAEVDMRPCPTCGRMQPDMIGQEKASAHTVVGVLSILLVIAPIVLGATYVIGGNIPTFIVAGILGLAAILQFFVAIENHNKNQERNIEKVQKYLDDGSMEQVKGGDTTQLAPPPALMRGGQFIGLALVFGGVVLALAPFGFQMMNGLVFNDMTKPDVISPGDEVKLYFPTEIDCVKSNWRSVSLVNAIKDMPKLPAGDVPPNMDFLPYSPPTAVITNAADLGVSAEPLKSSSSDKTWGGQFRVKSSQKHTHPWIWAEVVIPDDEKLVGQTIQLDVSMDILYPKVSGEQFFPNIDQAKQTFPLTIAKKGESSTYSSLWWGGLVGGTFVAFIGAMILRGSNRALKNSVPPPEVEVDEEEEDELPENTNEAEGGGAPANE